MLIIIGWNRQNKLRRMTQGVRFFWKQIRERTICTNYFETYYIVNNFWNTYDIIQKINGTWHPYCWIQMTIPQIANFCTFGKI